MPSIRRLDPRRRRVLSRTGRPVDLGAFADAVYDVARRRSRARSAKKAKKPAAAVAGVAFAAGAAAALVRRARRRSGLEPLNEDVPVASVDDREAVGSASGGPSGAEPHASAGAAADREGSGSRAP